MKAQKSSRSTALEKETHVTIASPIGPLTLSADNRNLTGLHFGRRKGARRDATHSPVLTKAIRQLDQFFRGKRKDFDLPLRPRGTPFQEAVWRALSTIPFGETRSYGEIAAKVGNPKASRAVGGANNRNPIAVIIPCHRVIGASGAMVGYGGGLSKKRWLLQREGRAAL